MSLNAEWADEDATMLPDRDAELVHQDYSSFAVPHCASCGGLVKPDAVFFGESVPRANEGRRSGRAEAATGNREYFLTMPVSIGRSRNAGDVP